MLQSKYTLSLDWLKIDMVKTVAERTISLTLFTDCNGNTIGLYIQTYCTVTEVHCDVIAYIITYCTVYKVTSLMCHLCVYSYVHAADDKHYLS